MLDIVFLICLCIFLLRGYRKGFVIALFSLLSIVIGVIGAIKLSHSVAVSLFHSSPTAAKWSSLIAFILVFFVIVWVVRTLAIFIQKSLNLIALGFVNRILGAFLYGIIVCLIFSVFIWLFSKMGILSNSTIQQSHFVKYIEPLAAYFFNLIGGIFPFVKSSFAYLNHFFVKVNSKIS